MAFAEGFGPDWTDELMIGDPHGAVLELVADDRPITGRLIDLEGRPVPDAAGARDPGQCNAREQPFLVARRDSKECSRRLQIIQSLHESLACRPLDSDPTGKDRIRRTFPASWAPAASGSFLS